MKEAKLI